MTIKLNVCFSFYRKLVYELKNIIISHFTGKKGHSRITKMFFTTFSATDKYGRLPATRQNTQVGIYAMSSFCWIVRFNRAGNIHDTHNLVILVNSCLPIKISPYSCREASFSTSVVWVSDSTFVKYFCAILL